LLRATSTARVACSSSFRAWRCPLQCRIYEGITSAGQAACQFSISGGKHRITAQAGAALSDRVGTSMQ
jgi:hypothetical protein